MPIDWRLLHGIDVNKMIRDTDLDMLERVVGIVAFGDLDGEDTCSLTDLNFLRIFRLSQLTAEYLLHVQDHLAQENSQLKDEGVRGAQHLEAVRLRVCEQKELLAGTNKELKRLRKTLKTYELLAEKAKEQAPVPAPALALPPVPTPPPAQAQPAPTQAAAPVMQLDPSTAWKLEKMELQANDMKEEREGLLQDIAKLKVALHQLAARHQGAGKEEVAAAVARTRREERLAADQRLTQALQNQQQRLQQQHQQQVQQQQHQQQQASPARRQDSHMNVNLSDSSEVQALQRDLADALARQRDSAQQKDALELELIALKKSAVSASPRQPPARRGSQVMFGSSSGSQGGQMSATAAAAEAKADRLARELEEAEEEISAMSSKMRQQEEVIAELEQGGAGPSRPSQTDPADADKAMERVSADLAEAEGELDEMTKNRDELQAVVDELEEKVGQLELGAQRVQLEQEDAAHPSTSSEAMQRLQQQVSHLTEEVAALEDENRRLSEVIQAESPHTEELLLHVKELQHEVTVTKGQADEARAAAEAATPMMQATSRFGETFRSFLPAARTSSTVLEVEFHPEMSPRPGPLEQGALESPKKLEELDRQEEEEALAQALANGNMGPQDDLLPEEEEQLGYPEDEAQHDTLEKEYQEQARKARRTAREEGRQAAEEGNAIQPLSGVAQRRLRLDMPHEMQGHVRPGVMSRFPHTLQDYQNTIEEMQEELQGEVAQELGSYGIDPYAEGLTDEQYTTAMAELASRRQLLLAGKEPEEQRRILAMRNNMLWHLQNVGGRAQRTGWLLPGGQSSSSPAAVEQRPHRAGPPGASPSRASVITVTSHGGETEAEEDHPVRRLLVGRSQQPQAAPRRLLGGPSGPTGPVRIPGASPVPKGTTSRPRSGPSRSIIHQDLLAPVMPGHESDEEATSEAEAEEGVSLGTGGVDRSGLATLRRRLGDDHVPRAHSQKGAAALRDVRDDFGAAQEQQEDAVLQGAAGQVHSRGTFRAARPGMPQLRTGTSNVAFATQAITQTALYSRSTLTRGQASNPGSPTQRGVDLNRAGQSQLRAGSSGRAGLTQVTRRLAPPPTPAPSPAGSPSIAAVYKPMQRSPEAQYRASRLRPIQSTKLRPLSEAPVASIAEASPEEAVTEEAHGSDGPSAPDSSPGQVEESQPAVQAFDARPAAPQGGHEQADDSNTVPTVKEGSLEGAKTTLSNPVFQSAVDDVSDVEELQ
ncbi:hypothetical protein WJX77_007386 [Trebouxia sp. C0004]